MSTSSSDGWRFGAGVLRGRVSSKGSSGTMLAVVFLLCAGRSASGLPGDVAAPRRPRLAWDNSNSTDGGGDEVTTVHIGAFVGDTHEHSPRFPVLPEAWTDGAVGKCNSASKVYSWRKWGWGSNINQMLLTWVGEIYEGRTDIALDLTGTILRGWGMDGVHCHPSAPKAEQQLSGWSCIFKPMRHLCVFERYDDLQEFVAAKEMMKPQPEAPRLQLSVNVFDDIMVPAAAMDFLYSNLQPWFSADIRKLLEEDELVSLRRGKFVAMHVRRGDKIRKEATKVEVQEYFQASASAILQATDGQLGIESITAVWVSSDDANVLEEARELAAGFFPNVRRERVVSISFRTVADRMETIPTRTDQMTYDRYVILHTELAMMSAADVFVGTFSSNVARMVLLLREGLGYPRNSTMSVDIPRWHPGRRS